MTDPRDQELEDYLAGKSKFSQLYQQLPADAPPPALDTKIRAAARREIGLRRPRWMLPLSAAAVIMLCVGVLMQLQQEGVTPLPLEQGQLRSLSVEPASTQVVPETDSRKSVDAISIPRAKAPVAESHSIESPGAVAEPLPMAPATVELESGKAMQDASEEAGSTRREEQYEDLMSAPVAADKTVGAEQHAQPRKPEDWIEYIRHLREAGQDAAAAAELKALRAHYPDYPLPRDLR